MKRTVGIIFMFLSIFVLSGCVAANTNKIRYEGKSENFIGSLELNKEMDNKLLIQYKDNNTIPKSIKFNSENLSGYDFSGSSDYSESLKAFSVIFKNTKKLEQYFHENIDEDNLTLTINWEDKSEEIQLKKVN
ncbi:hypothetical protein KPL33_09655 [Clostridium algidicarnis]|uniref:hypothetical protein n=1 Tax=Clostridium algidicarnis TaxID=37659 RepID=UPI001C0AEE99|nr:hypothetical protein [Clostridium algidicarnis]MBU3207243.1 hypothetical protein [Clostridium algidicarnis]